MTGPVKEVINTKELSDRIDLFGWGVLLLAVGAVALLPVLPDWAWLVTAGVVMLAFNAVRVWLHLAIHGLTVVVGIVALATGVCSAAGLETSVWPIVLVVLGVTFITGALYRSQRPAHHTSLGQSV
jgi:hypothetical protein